MDAAAAGVRRALADESADRLARVQLLWAHVEIALAAGDLQAATAAAEETESIARPVGTTAMVAIADCVQGAVALAAGDAEGAVPVLRRALRGWQGIDAPYEVAEVRVLLGKAYGALGDREGALQELRAASDTYEWLGASWAKDQTAAALAQLVAPARPERVRRAFLFTDIVRSTDLVSVIGDEAWENLLAWHDHTLQSLFASHGGEVAHPTGDGFFVAFGDAEHALACAVAIQRALAEHRRAHGFALQVRIGVHCAEATRRGQDYSGMEIHKAARIAALAGGGQILASEDVLREVEGLYGVTDAHEVTLKGIADPVTVGTVAWR